MPLTSDFSLGKVAVSMTPRERFEEFLQARGKRITRQRRAIVEHVTAHHEHFDAEQLLAELRGSPEGSRVSRPTVYRTLSVLESAGVVEGLDAGDGPRRFEHVINHDHHDHMVCTACGAILEFHDAQLERRQEAAARAHGFTIQRHSLRIYGTCSRCTEAVRVPKGARSR